MSDIIRWKIEDELLVVTVEDGYTLYYNTESESSSNWTKYTAPLTPIQGTYYFKAVNGNEVKTAIIGYVEQYVISEYGASDGAIVNSGFVKLDNAYFISNYAGTYGHYINPVCGGAIYNNGSMMFSSAIFNRNSADSYGGAICNCGNMTFSNAEFNGNTASSGGAIYNNNGSITIENATFSGNKASTYDHGSGGAIFNSIGNITISSAAFISNATGSYGGAVYNRNGNITLSSASFSGNTASIGGAILNTASGTITIESAAFSGNSANTGAAIYNQSGNIILGSASFNKNSATSGGIICNLDSMTLSNGVFSDNSGRVIQNGGNMTLSSAEFNGNSHIVIDNSGSMTFGSALFTDNSHGLMNSGCMTLSSATFNGNSGGAINNTGSGSMTLSSAAFSGNYASYNGGAINNTGSGSMTLSSAAFSGNCASYNGGAINNWFGSMTLFNATFTENSTKNDGENYRYYGGAIYNLSGSMTLSSATFRGNSAGSHGGAIFNSGRMTLDSATFNGNTASNGGAIFNFVAASMTISNAVFNGNTTTGAFVFGGAIFNYGTMNLQNTVFKSATDTIWNNGTMTFAGTISLAGWFYTANTITATGADMVFDISSYTEGNTTSIISNISLISGANSWSITVNADQTLGTYKLAANAGDFTGSMSVKVGESTLIESLTIDGATVTVNDVSYSLKHDDSNLILTITEKSLVELDWSWNISVDGKLEVSTEDGYTLYYATVENSEAWTSYTEALESIQGIYYFKAENENNIGKTNISGYVGQSAENGGAIYNSDTKTLENAYFLSNSATSNGGAIYNTGSMTLSSAMFAENSNSKVGGAIANKGSMTLSRVIFSKNSAIGGALGNTGSMTIGSAAFYNNSAKSLGGGIYNQSGMMNLSFADFSGNIGTNGGALVTLGGELTIDSAVFNSNSAVSAGGGIVMQRGSMMLANAIFTENSAGTIGGAIYNLSGNTTLLFGHFSGNLAENGGAVINGPDGSMMLDSAIFSENSATSTGGAIRNDTNMNLGSVMFSGNLADNGGAIFNSGSMTLSSVAFSGNSASWGGGAIHNCKDIIFSGASFNGNSADKGAAIYNAGAMTFSSASFNGNSANKAGAIYNGSSMIFSSVSFEGNSANGEGGAIDNWGIMTLSSGTFSGNSALTSGGAIFNAGGSGSMTLSSTTFNGNMASTGGAIYNGIKGSISLGSATFSGNSATSGGAIYNTESGTITFTNVLSLCTDTDTIVNSGTLNWDLTGETASYAKLSGYDKLTNSGTLSITVNASQKVGDYTIATSVSDTTGKNTFTLTGGTGDDVTITVGDVNKQYSGRSYSLAVTDQSLVLSVDNPLIAYELSESVSTKYDGDAHSISVTASESAENIKYYYSLDNGTTWNDGSSYSLTDAGAENVCFKITADGYKDTITSSRSITIGKRSVTLTSADDTKVYDGTALINNTVTVSGDGFVKDESYSANVTGTQTEVGSSKNTFSYELTNGATTQNYDVTKVEGTLEITKSAVPITITAKSGTRMYNGTAYSLNDYTYTGTLAEGDELVVTVTGSLTDVGTADNVVSSYKVMRGTEDVTGNYTFNASVKGTLTVTQRNVTLTSNSDSRKYNGEALKGTVTVTGDGFVTGEATASASSLTNAGSITNTITVNEDAGYKASNYNITKNEGTLEVTKRQVTLTSADASKEYDGIALTKKEITVAGDGFTDGEWYTADVTGSQLDAGSSKNTFTYELNEGTKSENYDITTVEGDLTVRKSSDVITVTANSKSKVYDGTALMNSGYSYTGTLVTGDELVVTVIGSILNVGSVKNVISSCKVMRGDTDVTSNYTFAEFVSGTLTVTKRQVTLTSADDSKEYDGTALTNDMITVSGDGFAAEEGYTANVTGCQTEIGASANKFTYELNSGTNENNYDIETVFGTLEVTKSTKDPSADDWYDLKTAGPDGHVGDFGEFSVGASYTDEIGKDDLVDYLAFTLDNAANVVFTVDSENAAKFSINSLQPKTSRGTTTYSLKSLQSTTLKAGVETETKALMLNAGTYYIGMNATDKKADAEYTITVSDKTVIYDKGDNSDDWTDMKTMGDESEDFKVYGDVTSETIGNTILEDWVGIGDTVDYMQINLQNAGNLVFTVETSDAAKFTIYQLQEKVTKTATTYSLKSLQSTTLKAGSTNTKELALSSGTYYLAMESTNKKTGDADYTVTLNEKTVFYDKGDNSDDWTDMKTMGGDSDEFKVYGDVTSETIGNTILEDWVGIGDTVDYMQIDLKNAGSVSFTAEASDAAKFTVYQLLPKISRGVTTYSLKSLQSTTLKAGTAVDTKALSLSSGTYYLAMESTNKKGGNADYTVELNGKTTFYDKGDNSDDNWEKTEKILAENSVEEDWLGVGDTIDYRIFTTNEDRMGNFKLSGVEGSVKLTVYTENKGKLKSVKSVSATAKKGAETGDLVLTAGTDYYIAVESKVNSTNYTLEVVNSDAFNRDNNTPATAEQIAGEYTGTLTKTKGGDALDYISAEDLDGFTLEMNSGSVKLSFFDEKNKAVKVSVTDSNGKVKTGTSITLKDGDKSLDSISCAALANVKYLKLEAGANNLCSYTLAAI